MGAEECLRESLVWHFDFNIEKYRKRIPRQLTAHAAYPPRVLILPHSADSAIKWQSSRCFGDIAATVWNRIGGYACWT